MLKKTKERLFNKQGISTLEFAICFMIFIMIFSYIFDLCLITYRQYVISEQTNLIARQIAKQSGTYKNIPNNFPGGINNYYTPEKLYDTMDKKMSNLNINSSDWKIEVVSEDKSAPSYNRYKSFTLSPNSDGFHTKYRDYITVKTTYKYKWGLWSQFAPGLTGGKTIAERNAFSEYNHDFSKVKE